MKKWLVLFLVVFGIFLVSCSSKEAEEKLAKVETELASKTQELESLQAEFSSLKAEFSAYQEKMKEFETLSEKEAEARKLEAEKKIAEEAAIQEEKVKEEQRIAAEKEAQGYETGITYDQLARTPDDHMYEKVKFSGKVLQVMEGTTYNNIRLAVDDDYDTVLLVTYDKTLLTQRILDNDRITVYGVSAGTTSYTTVLGATVTIPEMLADKIEMQ